MSFGLRVMGKSGEILLDTETKRFYTLAGRMISKTLTINSVGEAVQHQDEYITLPPPFTAENTLVVCELKDWRKGRKWYAGPIPTHIPNRIRWAYMSTYWDFSYTKPHLEFYIYTTLPISNFRGEYGLRLFNSTGGITFDTEAPTLQIEEYVTKNLRDPIHYVDPTSGLLSSTLYTGRIGLLVSACPRGQWDIDPSQGITPLMGEGYRMDTGGAIEWGFFDSSGYHVFGDKFFGKTSAAIVRLPDTLPPTIAW